MTTRPTQPATVTTTRTPAPKEFSDIEDFGEHPARGRFNSAFFWVMGGYINWHMHKRKSAAFADLPPTVVELGAGVGANMRYLPVGARLIAIEPNPYMHMRLRRAARSRGVDLEIRSVVAERIDLPDASADAVISSLVLCSVRDPDA
ncbi:MAG TPA: class I SAM-dependent methyltransferase, partial [Microlunatus sp.]|nr:class I SAM-dependent methyltransferase [Microlunatus sp.]